MATRYGGNGDVIDIDDLRLQVGRWWRRIILPGMIVLVAVAGLLTCYYQVEAEEVALVQRFGRYHRTTHPGPHFRWPFGMETVTKVPVKRQHKEEFGFRTAQAGVRTEFVDDADTTRSAEAESLMLTGDLNVVNVEWIVQFQIKDPYQLAFKVRRPIGTLRDLAEGVMREIVGDHSVTEVLTVGREAIAAAARLELQELANKYELGVAIEQLVLQDVDPPESVRGSFNEVNQAIQERERLINEARAEYNRVIPTARGEAQRTLSAAEGYGTERVNRARGDVHRFVAVQSEYARAPSVTRTRLYLEAMAEVLPKSGRRVVVDSSAKNLLPLLNLDKVAP